MINIVSFVFLVSHSMFHVDVLFLIHEAIIIEEVFFLTWASGFYSVLHYCMGPPNLTVFYCSVASLHLNLAHPLFFYTGSPEVEIN